MFYILLTILLNKQHTQKQISPRITKNTCTFTLNSNHKQTNIVYDKNNIMYIITIEHIDATPKLSNNIYKISYTASKKWTAYFYAKILQNKFLSCYSPHVTALTGKIRTSIL
ncbi:DUF5626 family protein [Faecalimonas sp.]